jgi:hypothetical protein
MPRVHHVKKARKDHGENIKKGDSYYWWKFNYGPKVKSKTYPRRSQLTRSDFLGTYYDIQDGFEPTPDSIIDDLSNLIDDVSNLRDETQERFDNMPENLQETSSSGEMLQERIDGLEGWISDLESIDADSWEENFKANLEGNETEDEIEEKRQEAFDELVQEIQDADPGL